jgi:pimeloyl-ACP methyl ester carboxylesterase
MTPHFTFVPGWGSGPGFWKKMLTLFEDHAVSHVDLGFTGSLGHKPESYDFLKPSIYVTHSLGTMWALKKHSPNIRALITINGFHCFRHFICERTLRAMKERLKRNPVTRMVEFWEKCGISPANSGLNPERLQEGLEWLISWNAGRELSSLSCPVLVLAGGADPILPLPLMRWEWNGYNFHVQKNGGHALPWTDAPWCAGKIREFVDGLRLEA